MKSVLKEKTVAVTPAYPALMKSKTNGQIVFFYGLDHGVVVYKSKDSRFEVGESSNTWVPCTDTETWEKYVGEVTLSN